MNESRVTPYRREQRRGQARWKRSTAELSPAARAPGRWFDVPAVSFILPVDCALETLWSPIRNDVVQCFESNDVVWHEGDCDDYGKRSTPGPSPNLLDSQVLCLNFWWGLAQRPEALKAVLREPFPEIERLVPPCSPGRLLEPEWIGTHNYLGEASTTERPRRRGQYTTSADLLLAFEDASGKRHGILLESKYTESYGESEWRCERAPLYGPAYQTEDGTFRKDRVSAVEDLLIEPFYQHFRQQLLAAAMENAHELDFTTVTVLHVAPQANISYHETITSPHLSRWGRTVSQIWKALLRVPDRYRSISYEAAFRSASLRSGPLCDSAWLDYVNSRYGWNDDGAAIQS